MGLCIKTSCGFSRSRCGWIVSWTPCAPLYGMRWQRLSWPMKRNPGNSGCLTIQLRYLTAFCYYKLCVRDDHSACKQNKSISMMEVNVLWGIKMLKNISQIITSWAKGWVCMAWQIESSWCPVFFLLIAREASAAACPFHFLCSWVYVTTLEMWILVWFKHWSGFGVFERFFKQDWTSVFMFSDRSLLPALRSFGRQM